MTRITTRCGNGTLTVEVPDNKIHTIKSPFVCASEAIKEANEVYEQDGNHFDYLSRVHSALSLCSAEMHLVLMKKCKYF